MARIRVNLRTLPTWLQYIMALSVAGVVIAAAWMVGGERPVPPWIVDYLIPIWQWVGLALLLSLCLTWLLKKARQ